MKRAIKEINNSYKKNLSEIPLPELGKIVYNKQIKALEKISNETSIEEFKELDEIMKTLNYNKRCYLISTLFMATLTNHLKIIEENYKNTRKRELIYFINEIFSVSNLKDIYESIDSFKKTNDITFLNNTQTEIESMIKIKEKYIMKNEKNLENLKDIIEDKISENEIYHSKEDFQEASKSPKFNEEVISKVYNQENIFKSILNSDKTFKKIISNCINNYLTNGLK